MGGGCFGQPARLPWMILPTQTPPPATLSSDMQPLPANFYEETKSARKIIVVDLGFLGDSVHLVPALWEIKRHYPTAQLHTLSAAVGAELLGLVPCVDRAWAFPLTPQSPPWWRHWDIIGALRREKYRRGLQFQRRRPHDFPDGADGRQMAAGA